MVAVTQPPVGAAPALQHWRQEAEVAGQGILLPVNPGLFSSQEHREVIHCCTGDKHSYLDFTCGDIDSF